MSATAIIAALALLPVSAAAAEIRARYLMGTVCEIAAGRPEQIEAAFAEAKRVETMLSTWTDESELARVNRGEVEPSPELKALLDTTLVWADRTGRAFDPRIGHLVVRSAAALPPLSQRAERASGASESGGRATALQHPFEEGAFGKGYALDRMLALIEGEAVLNFGGQIAVRGSHEVNIADPANRDEPVLTLTITNASLSTSAGAHILDPRTGHSAGERGSVSVIAADALTADILSTALYVLGADEGLRFAATNDLAAIFIDTKHTIRLSPAARTLEVAVLDRDFSLED